MIYLKIIYSLYYFLLIKILKFFRKNTDRKKNILLIKIDAIGDNILFLPYFEEIKNIFFDKNIYLLTSKKNFDLYSHIYNDDQKVFSKIIFIDENKAKRNFLYFLSFLKYLNGIGFNSIFQLRFNKTFITDDLISYYLEAKRKISIYSGNFNTSNILINISNKFYSNSYKLKKDNYDFKNYYLSTLEFYNEFGINKINIFKIFNNLKLSKKHILIHAGGSDPYRTWGIKNFCKLAKEINTIYPKILIIKEKDLEFASKELNEFNGKIILEKNLRFKDLISLVSNSKLVVSNETSITHISCFLKIKNICLLGGGGFDVLVPYKLNFKILNKYIYPTYKRMNCFGCKWQCTKSLSNNDNYQCLNNIETNDVKKIIDKLII